MKDLNVDPIVAQWLREGPDEGPDHGLNRALAATRKVSQRSRLAFPRTWLPAPVAEVQVRVPRVVMIALTLLLTLLVLIALALAIGGRPAVLPFVLAPDEEVIAFAEAGEIYVVQPDASGRTSLNLGVANATAPVFSPDGTRVAFLGSDTPDGPVSKLFIVAVDGSEPRLVEASGELEVLAGEIPNYSWSPDSTRIAFSAMDGGAARIFVVDRDGANPRALTDGSEHSDLPSWSPVAQWLDYTGDWIVYRVTQPDGSGRRFDRVHPDGTGLEVVAAVVGPGSNLSKLTWSPPDPNVPGSYVTSYAMNVGFGSETRAVIDGGVGHALEIWANGVGGFADAPIPWSPDSRFLAFISGDGGLIVGDDDRTSDLYDGELRDLGPVFDCWVDWSADSEFLYGGAPNGCAGIVVVPFGHPQDARTLTNAPGTGSWRPQPK